MFDTDSTTKCRLVHYCPIPNKDFFKLIFIAQFCAIIKATFTKYLEILEYDLLLDQLRYINF